MRYVAIPTRGSKMVLRNLRAIAAASTKVLLVAEQVEFSSSELPSNVEVETNVVGLAKAREHGVRWAESNGAPWVIEIDDDIRADFAAIFARFESLLDSNPFLGSLSSIPSMFQFYSRDHRSNKEYRFQPFPTQLWAMRISAYNETRGFTLLETMEDLYIGLAMWKNGYASATLPEHAHAHLRKRLDPNRDQGTGGGQPVATRHEWMPRAVELMKEEFVGNVLKSAALATMKNGLHKPAQRYNWEEMTRRLNSRFGAIGYEDRKVKA